MDRILEEESRFEATVEDYVRKNVAGRANDRAMVEGITGPVTYPMNPPYHYAYTVTWNGTIDTTHAFLVTHDLEWVKWQSREQEN